ncbi:MAG: electron transport complex subunit RsxE [Candidatus Omnitrophota bacterium]|nr:MAG: electron transport complex subunit RsxE [Candidatus Omnitrophota bacterium]
MQSRSERLWKRVSPHLRRGIFKENPIFVLMIGLCPVLAITTSVSNALGMGLAVTFVLLGSNSIISCLRKVIPREIRLPCFIVIIASFVTIVELLLKAFFPLLDRSLGIFVPLITVNCIILGRAEAFASKNSLKDSIIDALAIGIGFTCALILISSIREVLGNGKIFGLSLGFPPALFFLFPAGAFLVIGILMGIIQFLRKGR